MTKFKKYRLRHSWLQILGLRLSPRVPQSPYFDPDWYLATYDDVRRAGLSPWTHFIEHGAREGRQPSPYFDIDHFVSHRPDAFQNQLDPLAHYETIDAFLGGTPNVYFDAGWYASQINEVVGKSDLFLHYLHHGWKSKIAPSPYFDIKWYLTVNADVAAAGTEPLRHYIEFGHREGRQPNPYFDVQYYRDTNIDVAQSGLEPLKHYLTAGWREPSRQPNAYFNKEWYRRQHMSDEERDQDPLYHFIVTGSYKNLATSPEFDPEFYLRQSPEIGLRDNVFHHFMTVGREAGRRPNARVPKPARDSLIIWAKANGYRPSVVDQIRQTFDLKVRKRTPEQVIRLALARLLGRVDAVSFDIFDTLVERNSGAPESVFALVEERAAGLGYSAGNFSVHRQEAELIARRRSGQQEVRLTEIYGEFKAITGCSDIVCSTLLDAEIDTEVMVCECKPVGRILFDMAVRAGKQILLISDIYLPQETVKLILSRCGYDASFKLFVSSELGATKHYGHLYEYVLSQTSHSADRIVHIGDNAHSDGDKARAAGFQTLLVPKARWSNLEPSGEVLAGSKADIQMLWPSLVKAECEVKSARTEVERDTGSESVDLASLGAYVLGPLMLDFTLLLARKALENRYRKLFFASRDAFYLKEAYEIVRKFIDFLPEAQYFYASRKVCRFATIGSVEDISSIANVDHYPMSVRNFLVSRFMFEPDDLQQLEDPTNPSLDHLVLSSRGDQILKATLNRHKNQIMSSATAHREAYLAYLNSIDFNRANNAIVDIGYRGTIQRSLAGLTGMPVAGIYLMVWPEAENLLSAGLRFDAFIRRDPNPADVMIRNLQVFELLLSGTHGSVSKFSMENGSPTARLAEPDTTSQTRAALNEIRAAALRFVEDMCQRYAANLLKMRPQPEVSISSFRDLLRMPPAALVHALQHHVVEDDFGGETRRLITPPGNSITFDRALEESCWKEGTASLWRAIRTGYGGVQSSIAEAPIDFFDGRVSRAACR